MVFFFFFFGTEKYSLCGDLVLLDGAIDEAGEVLGSVLSVLSSLGDGELVEELIEHLQGFLVLGGDGGSHGIECRCHFEEGSKRGCSLYRKRGFVEGGLKKQSSGKSFLSEDRKGD